MCETVWERIDKWEMHLRVIYDRIEKEGRRKNHIRKGGMRNYGMENGDNKGQIGKGKWNAKKKGEKNTQEM